MKKVILLTLLFCGLLLIQARTAAAHGGITVNGNFSDWGVSVIAGGSPPGCSLTMPAAQTGAILTFPGTSCGTLISGNEYIWKDNITDERTDFASPDGRVDIDYMAITSDANDVYFLVKLRNTPPVAITGNGAPQIQIAIDRDRINGSGEPFLANFSDTQVDPNAEWEYLLYTRFGSNNPAVGVWQNGYSAGTPIFRGAAAFTTQFIELSVPWSDIGGFTAGPLRFTVSSYRSDTTDTTWDLVGFSDALDAVTTAAPNTWDEVSDGVINYYFDVAFQTPTAVTLSQQHATPVAQTVWVLLAAVTLAVGTGWYTTRQRPYPRA